MSADLLRKAATLIAKYALDANDSGSPWATDYHTILGADGEVIAETQDGRAPALWEAEWIALMHPGIATPLVTWLRDTADQVDRYEGYPEFANAAVDFANAVLREDA